MPGSGLVLPSRRAPLHPWCQIHLHIDVQPCQHASLTLFYLPCHYITISKAVSGVAHGRMLRMAQCLRLDQKLQLVEICRTW